MPNDAHTAVRTNIGNGVQADVDAGSGANDAVARVLAEHAPQQWPVVAPWSARLFGALAAGHSCLKLSRDEADGLLRQAPDLVGTAGSFKPFIADGGRLYLGRIWQIEQDIAYDLLRLAEAAVPPVDTDKARVCLAQWFGGAGSQKQQQAAAVSLFRPLSVINGGPGTGKTTTVAKLLALICQTAWPHAHPPRIALTAPTGKAAAHMAQSLQAALQRFDTEPATAAHLRTLQGKTLHRLLKLQPPLMRSQYEAHTLPADIVVVDESSMLDLSLFRTLLRVMETGTRVIFLGDADQLPAVGAGNVLRDLTQEFTASPELAAQLHSVLPQTAWQAGTPQPLADSVTTLTYSHRFAGDSGIGALARAVLAGNENDTAAAFAEHSSELALHSRSDEHLCAPLYRLQAAYWQAVAEKNVAAVFDTLDTVMVLCVWRRDAVAFNRTFRHFLQQHGHAAGQVRFAGLPLMVTQNDYYLDVFNGDVGVVLPDASGQMQVYFPDGGGGFRAISPGRLPEHQDAFAITVHKSQGSEYENVWLLAPQEAQEGDEADILFDRSLLYTAVTRAKKHFVFAGDVKQLQLAARQHQARTSGLREALRRQAHRFQAA